MFSTNHESALSLLALERRRTGSDRQRQLFQACQPRPKPWAFLADLRQACFLSNRHAIDNFIVSPNSTHNALARRGFVPIVDVFGRFESSADLRERSDIPLVHVCNHLKRGGVGKQQTLKLVFLNIRKHFSRAKILPIYFLTEVLLQFFHRPPSPISETI